MRKLFVAAVIAVFAAYCWAAYRNHTFVQVPQYLSVQADLLGGLSPVQWEGGKSQAEIKASASFRREHLRGLERRRLQPPASGRISVGGRGFDLPPQNPLGHADLEALVAEAVASGRSVIELRDPAELLSLARHGYRLRDPVTACDLRGGEQLTKPVLDDLIAAGVSRVAVIGSGQPVAPQPATIVMVILIFMALATALKGALWEPVLAMIDSRKQDVERGKELVRENRAEAARIEDETRARRKKNRQEYLAKLLATQRQALQEADRILGEARGKARAMRDEASAELERALAEAEGRLRSEIPVFGRSIAEQALGRPPQGAK